MSSTCILRFPVSNSYEFVSRKRRLNDKSVPNVILYNPSFADDSKMYQDLLEMERKLDWTMMRKRVEIQDALGRVPTVSISGRFLYLQLSRDRIWRIPLPFLTERRAILVFPGSAYPFFFRRQGH